MSLPHSTFYDAPSEPVDDVEIVGRMQAICDEFETYGYRRVSAALRGVVAPLWLRAKSAYGGGRGMFRA